MSRKPDSYFDKRTVARNIKRKRITREEYDEHLENLEDATDKSMQVLFDQEAEME